MLLLKRCKFGGEVWVYIQLSHLWLERHVQGDRQSSSLAELCNETTGALEGHHIEA